MSYHTRLATRPRTVNTLRADLLLASPALPEAAPLAARILAGLGHTGQPRAARRLSGQGSCLLTVQTGALGLTLGLRAQPLSGAHFLRAFAPYSDPSARARRIAVIAHHQAHVSLRLRQHWGGAPGGLHRRLLAALRLMADELSPAGLLWGDTGRLFAGDELAGLLHDPAPARLLCTPRLTTTGRRRQVCVELDGAPGALGFAVRLLPRRLEPAAAFAAAHAFARACLIAPDTRRERSFRHETTTWRIAHADGSRDVTLIALPPPVSAG